MSFQYTSFTTLWSSDTQVYMWCYLLFLDIQTSRTFREKEQTITENMSSPQFGECPGHYRQYALDEVLFLWEFDQSIMELLKPVYEKISVTDRGAWRWQAPGLVTLKAVHMERLVLYERGISVVKKRLDTVREQLASNVDHWSALAARGLHALRHCTCSRCVNVQVQQFLVRLQETAGKHIAPLQAGKQREQDWLDYTHV